jgi:hypothetical protein
MLQAIVERELHEARRLLATTDAATVSEKHGK